MTNNDAQAEIVRLNKIISALMDRVELSSDLQGSDFSLFHTAIMLEKQVRQRTKELKAALHDREKATLALRTSEALHRAVVEQSLIGICFIEGEEYTFINPRFSEIFGYSVSELMKTSPLSLALDEDKAVLQESLRLRMAGEIDLIHYSASAVHKNKSILQIEVFGNTVEINGRRIIVSLVNDITDRIKAEQEIRQLQNKLQEQSFRDPLTNLHNRRYLNEVLQRELILAIRAEHPISFIMCDIDHFKTINDTFGHTSGDQILCRFAQHIRSAARASDICCRYGGEEFLLVLPQMPKSEALCRAEKLRTQIADLDFALANSSIRITASFGVAAYPADGTTGAALISAADQALYTAKDQGRNRVIGTPE